MELSENPSQEQIRHLWYRLAVAPALLCIEAALLTPYVEFHPTRHASLVWLAEPMLFSAVILVVAGFICLVSILDGVSELVLQGHTFRQVFLWSVVQLLLYALFFTVSLRLNQATATNRLDTVLWGLLALGTASSAFLIAMTVKDWCALIRRCRCQMVAAILAGVLFFVLVPTARRLWPIVCDPAMRINVVLIEQYPGNAVYAGNEDGLPLIGTEGMLLLVTPACSELESLLAFCLMGGTILCAAWRGLHRIRFLIMLGLGLCAFYGLNALRIYTLLLIGWSFSAEHCVRLAHSRVASVVFIAVSVLVCTFAARWSLIDSSSGH